MRHPKRKMGNCAGNTISEHRQPRVCNANHYENVFIRQPNKTHHFPQFFEGTKNIQNNLEHML